MSPEAPPRGPVQSIGPHRYIIEDDLLFWQPCGEVTIEQAHIMNATIADAHRRNGYLLYLIDGRQARPLGAAARRIAVDGFRALVGTTSLAAFGTNMIVRTAAFLVLNAARLLSGLDIPSSFVDTEPEARAFLAAERARLQAERSRRQARSGS